MTRAKANRERLTWIVAAACLAVIVIIGIIIWQRTTDKSPINSFDACKDAGGSVAESYPEQCFIDGKSFVNDKQSVGTAEGYIGLTEQAALDKARAENKLARIVQRDDESLPITMDLVEGRLNLYIRAGTVEKVDIERINP